MKKIIITGDTLTLEEVAAVCRNYEEVELSDYAVQKIIESRKVVDEFVENEKVVYALQPASKVQRRDHIQGRIKTLRKI